MYEEFFGLRARPFGITPSADLFFHSSAHRRTLACLLGQVLAGEPLIVLTGNIGAGKTTVLQVLLRNLSDKFVPAVLVSTQLDEVELTAGGGEDVRAAPPREVAALPARAQARFEEPAQLPRVLADDVQGGRRRVLAPEQVDQLAHADRLAGAGQQDGEQERALAGPGVDLLAAAPHPQRAEDLQPQRAGLRIGGWHAP